MKPVQESAEARARRAWNASEAQSSVRLKTQKNHTGSAGYPREMSTAK